VKHPFLLVAAIALAVFVVRRRTKLEPTLLVGASLAAIGCLLVGIGVVPLPNVEAIIEEVGQTLGTWTYLFVAVFAFLETGAFVGLLAPGETVIIVGGVVAGQGRIDLMTLIGLTWACAVAGDVTSFLLGRRLGREFMVRHGGKVGITEERLVKVEEFFERHGGPTILIGRFVGLVRALAPFIAGASRMPLRTFLPYDLVGAGLWSGLFCVLGYVFYQSIDKVTEYAGTGALAFGTIVSVVVAGVVLHRITTDAAYRAKARAWIVARPGGATFLRVTGPVWERLAGPIRFFFARITPGELGLELTTLLALVIVGGFSLAYFGNADVEMLDQRAFEVIDTVQNQGLTDVLRVLTDIGSLPVAAAVVLLTAGLSLRRGHAVPAAALVIGFIALFVLVHVTKEGYGRLRPEGPLGGTFGFSYPSGHTAYGVALVACAVVLVRSGWPLALRFAAVAVAVGLAVFVGLTRIYLHAHYLSDVLGGAGLALAVLGTAGIVSLVITHVRDNVGET
jgi:undecaprenyl-diphosphatase